MYPLVGFASQAQRYVSKGRRFLSDAPFGRFSESLARRLPKICAGLFSFSFLLKFLSKNLRFGRSLAKLILHALSIYPSEAKEGPERRFLSDVPFGRFCLPGRFGLGSCLLGPSGLEYGLLGWIWGLPSWNLAFGGLLHLNLNSCCFLGLFVFCCTVVAYLPTNLFTLSARLLINTVSSHARRSISHKDTP